MTIKERAKVLYDFSTCLNTDRKCKNCAASKIICDMEHQSKARDIFFKETAEILEEFSLKANNF